MPLVVPLLQMGCVPQGCPGRRSRQLHRINSKPLPLPYALSGLPPLPSLHSPRLLYQLFPKKIKLPYSCIPTFAHRAPHLEHTSSAEMEIPATLKAGWSLPPTGMPSAGAWALGTAGHTWACGSLLMPPVMPYPQTQDPSHKTLSTPQHSRSNRFKEQSSEK